jgi:hypothetical protein
LTILQDLGTRKTRNGKTTRVILCLCDCGNQREIVAAYIKAGKNISCGLTTCPYSINGKHRIDSLVVNDIKNNFSINQGTLSEYKRNAIARNLSWNIDENTIYNLYLSQNGECAITALKLNSGKNKDCREWSIDRIDSNKGYEPDNIRLVHKIINMFKNKYSDEAFYLMVYLISQNMSLDMIRKFNGMRKEDIKDKLKEALKYKATNKG